MPVTNVLCKKKAKDYPEIHWKSYIDGDDDDDDDDNEIICIYMYTHMKVIKFSYLLGNF
jgi:hypothetical protein